MKELIIDIRADIKASKEYQVEMETSIAKLLLRQKVTGERIDNKLTVLCDELEKRGEHEKQKSNGDSSLIG